MAIKKISNKKSSNKKKLITTKKTEGAIAIKRNINRNSLVNSDNPKKKPRKKKRHIVLNGILSILMIICIVIICAILAFCGYIVLSAPDFDTDKLYNAEASIFYDKNGKEFARVGAEQRELKTYDELPQVLIDAIIATEDSRYFQHNGFDVVRFVKASIGQVQGDSGAGGASTLTMQVAKNTFSRGEDGTIASSGVKGIIRKFTDIYMSIFKIERNYTKEEILEFYVNAPFLGSNTYGVEQACQKYFGKSVSDITLTEAALLAGIFNAPSQYNPYYSTELATKRRNTVLNLMVRHGYITEDQAKDAKAIKVESLIAEPTTASLNKYQQFIDVVSDEIKDRTGYDPYVTPMEVYTTMDPEIQDVWIKLNEGKLNYKWKTYRYNDYKDIIQIGGVILDSKDGSIAGVNGGRHQTVERAYSRATDMKRQPGSTAKPIFAYGPYIEYNNGSPGTIFYDNKMTYSNGQELTNADKTYLGAITMRQALARSRNIPAVQAFQAVDKAKIGEFVHNLGIDYGDNLYESYAIGGGIDLSPLDMAAAYSTFARGGYYIEPYSFTKAIFRETDEVYEHKYEKVKAMSEETAYMITDILITATKQGVGGKINVSGTEIASKTGTSTYSNSAYKYYKVPSSASADNWVLTYSPDYTISFWYGVDELGTKSYTDAIAAAVQRKLISAQLASAVYPKNSKFKKPDGIVRSKYEKETIPAQLPSDYTPGGLIGSDVFKKGTEPSEVSDRFSQLKNPSNGSASVSGSQVNLSWSAISTPNAISNSYLQNYFSENYGDQASYYLKRRLNYNSSNVGDVGYQVFLQTDTGLKDLGYTSNTYFAYNTVYNGSYTFIVKSAYSIFKANMSSGLTITANVTDGQNQVVPVEPTQPTEPEQPEPVEPEQPEEPLDQ